MYAVWNQLAVENGFSGIYLIAMNTGWGFDARTYLYDAYMNFEPIHTLSVDKSFRKVIQQWKSTHINDMNKDWIHKWLYAQNSYSYSYLCKKIENSEQIKERKTFLGIFSGWDNTPRKDEAGLIVTNSTPKKFQKNIEHVLRLSEKMNNEYIFLNAWNEWSEGAYIEPDEKYRFGYLRAIRNAINNYGRKKNEKRVLYHIYYQE